MQALKTSRAGWLLALLLLAVLVAAGCGGDDDDSTSEAGGDTSATSETSGGGEAAAPLSLANCDDPDGSGQFTIVSDLPLQGSSRLQTTQMVEAIRYVLEKADYKAGDYTMQYESFDDSTAAAGKWDSAKCSANARTRTPRDKNVIGVDRHVQLGLRRHRDPDPQRGRRRWPWSRRPTRTSA